MGRIHGGPSDADIRAGPYKVYQRRRRALLQQSLWLDESYWSLVRIFEEDPPLDHHDTFDQRLDLTQLAARVAKGTICATLERPDTAMAHMGTVIEGPRGPMKTHWANIGRMAIQPNREGRMAMLMHYFILFYYFMFSFFYLLLFKWSLLFL